jgi:hypothetical protein
MTNTATDKYTASPIDAIADGDIGFIDDASTPNVDAGTSYTTKAFSWLQVKTYLTTNLFAKLDTAQEYTATQNFNATSLTSTAASIAWDAAANQVTKHTFTENTTLANPTKLKDGATYIITFTQHASSPKTLAFGSAYKWPGGTAPTITATNSAVDIITFVSDGTNLYGVRQPAFS